MTDELLEFARQVVATEASAVRDASGAVDAHFARAARMILECPGSLLTSGVGKAGHIAGKLAATFASTGTPAHFLSAADAIHGDVGAIRRGDVVLLLSYSGESDEILRLLEVARRLDHPVIAMTATRSSRLGRHADPVIALGRIAEACPLGLAPSSTTTAMLAVGDALALSVMKLRRFSAEDFAAYHPAGQLGRRLLRVREAMTFRAGENLPLARDDRTVGQVLSAVASIKRRCGAVVLVDGSGRLSGIFSDGDLRRLITGDDAALRRPMAEVMTRDPASIHGDALASEAMAVMHRRRFDELPVVDDGHRPIGVIDIQDLLVLRLYDDETTRDVASRR